MKDEPWSGVVGQFDVSGQELTKLLVSAIRSRTTKASRYCDDGHRVDCDRRLETRMRRVIELELQLSRVRCFHSFIVLDRHNRLRSVLRLPRFGGCSDRSMYSLKTR